MAPQKAQSGSEPETLPEVQTSGKSNECLDPLSGQAMTVEEAKSEIELLTKKVGNYSEPPHFNKAIPLLRSKPDIVINI